VGRLLRWLLFDLSYEMLRRIGRRYQTSVDLGFDDV
jgi:hypothetical protein